MEPELTLEERINTEGYCKTELGKRLLVNYRGRPDEHLMYEFIEDAEKLGAALAAAIVQIDLHVAGMKEKS